MIRVNRILKHTLFLQEIENIDLLEKERMFCGHGLVHLMDVARIGYLYILENRVDIPKHILYAAALLHDIGRARQYLEQIPHEEAGTTIAIEILDRCGYTKKESQWITEAIMGHREVIKDGVASLSDILYLADKRSRNCFACQANKLCNWPEGKKNDTIEW